MCGRSVIEKPMRPQGRLEKYPFADWPGWAQNLVSLAIVLSAIVIVSLMVHGLFG